MPNVRKLAGDITEDTIHISWKGEDVAALTRRINDAGETEYVFIVDWKEWDRINPPYGIPGLYMDARLDEYVRYDTPVFMTGVMPPMNREDVPDMLKQFNLPANADMWDLMIAQGRICNDGFRVHR